MQLFIYEYITGGGLFGSQEVSLPNSLLCEGRAMVEAVAADFARSAGVEATLLRDPRVAIQAPGCRVIDVDSDTEAASQFDRLASAADWTLVIAPESGGTLLSRCLRVEQCGGRLLGAGPAIVELCSDKHTTIQHLTSAGVPAPQGIVLASGFPLPTDYPYPAVLKPRNGCGSQNVQVMRDSQEASQTGVVPWPARLEHFCPGIAASVAVLCGPNGLHVLPPCYQRLSRDGRFQYLGGALPLPRELAQRAADLAVKAVRTLPEPRGYIGVDVVLGESSRHAPRAVAESVSVVAHDRLRHTECADYFPGDCIIEINPRLTTSYVGLRAACRENLAEAMLRIAQGESAELLFRDDPLQFDADGTVRFLQESP